MRLSSPESSTYLTSFRSARYLICRDSTRGRDPNHWKNPDEFSPERFMSEDRNGQSRLDVRGQHFQFVPFGSGRRGCPGTSLALQVVQINLAAMIQCFEWKVDGTVSMEEKAGITAPRAHPLICVPVPRLHPFPSISF
ncbi:hypothetical protein K1719_006768 [Acacia pycnantha]|nr:hypothetical protein K1719_006768 [Acacia pycnantha]